jgi:hypothetical protein
VIADFVSVSDEPLEDPRRFLALGVRTHGKKRERQAMGLGKGCEARQRYFVDSPRRRPRACGGKPMDPKVMVDLVQIDREASEARHRK